MSLTIYFLRHGQTELSREDKFCGSGLNPQLTADGDAMAQAFATTYRNTPWRAIYTSKLQRAISTGKPLADACEIPTQVRADLNEIAYGEWEGMTKDAVDASHHDDYINWLADPAWHAPTGGELAIEIARRGLRAIEEIEREHEEGNVLVVSHKATIRIMLCSLLGIDVGRFRYRLACPVGSLSVVEFTRAGPLLQSLADRSHLSESLRALPGT